MRSIQEMRQEIKNWVADAVGEWGLIIIVFLVALGSFGLGRLSALEDARPPVSIEQVPSEQKPQGMYMGGLFVASRTGSVYYYPWCTGAQKILPTNQAWFPSEGAAQKAGYRPAKNCKGLGQPEASSL
ncbi:hypothetical protein A2851_03305 [Candidatus Kaiserbacteria bacterium RIFCSPHIGHO2_01_FULL_53_29]|uniref:Ada DNA repair metal-binding domain-containing protein n=1 Tax=Candidatus Kaiserbacteria bacterium RIFCSPHIGHO2_01_FULL_53_29 TaxID=1798480 RepID=A0A1F6CXM1_9BACT|nr:MAG: hypothetical protein A2851_03305 [Candidatus Kaiserbacteria bacterium RIFCSPHIGHO2_01_FULL_53_29]